MYDAPSAIRHCPPEFRLLIAASWMAPQPFADAQTREIVACCRGGVSWRHFLTLVGRHEVAAVAYTNLRHLAGREVPDQVVADLRKHQLVCRAAAQLAADETARICTRFHTEGIEVIPLKGAVLAQRLFGDPSMRQCGDIDVLIRPHDMARAILMLEEEGYVSGESLQRFTPAQQRHICAVHTHLVFRHPRNGQWLELHWGIDRWSGENVAELWSGCVKQTLGEARFNLLDDETLVVFLCDHGGKHYWGRGKWMSDLAMLLAYDNGIAWDLVVERSRRLDGHRSLAVGSLLVSWWYGIPLPEPLRTLLGQERSAAAAARFCLASQTAVKSSLPIFRRIARGLGAIRVERFLFGRRFPWLKHLQILTVRTADFTTCPLPDHFFWLYYLLRPFLWMRHRHSSPTVSVRPANDSRRH